LHLTTQLEVQGPEGLVEQQERWAIHEGARERNPLLLPSRKLLRLAGGEVIEFDEPQSLVRFPERIGNVAPTKAEGNVL